MECNADILVRNFQKLIVAIEMRATAKDDGIKDVGSDDVLALWTGDIVPFIG